MGYGGPHAAYFATKKSISVPCQEESLVYHKMLGNRALRMALQTREQHIKREKATSNICTAQVLLSVMAGMFAVYHGPKGLQYIADKVHGMASTLADALNKLGVYQTNTAFFDTIVVKQMQKRLERLQKRMKLISFISMTKQFLSL
jgi:glycine dehydrogenase